MTVLDVLSKQRLVSLWLLEEHEEEDADYKRVACEDEPCSWPVTDSVCDIFDTNFVSELVNDRLGCKGSHCSANTVGHKHEQTLGAVLELALGARVGVEGSRDVEDLA